MTEAEMRAAAARVRMLDAAKERLERAQHDLALVNRFVKAGTVWRPSLQLEHDSYTRRSVEITITIPAGIVQQQAVYAVDAARREVIKLGGTP